MSSDLPEDLILEIFTRLPPKSLLRFRSLSKSLCSCIASPNFIRMHTFRSPQKYLIRHKRRKNGIESKNRNYDIESEYFYTLHSEDQLPLCPQRGYIGIKAVKFPYETYCKCVGSCNGILSVFDFECRCITLWNPSTRRKLALPYFPRECSSSCPQSCSCVWSSYRFDPNKIGSGFDPNRIGFGFDPIKDDYKIVILPKYGATIESSYVCAIKTSAWCAISCPLPFIHNLTSHGYFFNGALHWVVKRSYNGLDGFYILTFNLSTHVFGKIVLPEPSWETKKLTTLRGSLAVFSSKDGDSCIWVMGEDNNAASWSVVFKLKTNQIPGALQRVLQHTTNGDVCIHTFHDGFQVYDPKIGAQSMLILSYIAWKRLLKAFNYLTREQACNGR